VGAAAAAVIDRAEGSAGSLARTKGEEMAAAACKYQQVMAPIGTGL
jgi:hypothetical protein